MPRQIFEGLAFGAASHDQKLQRTGGALQADCLEVVLHDHWYAVQRTDWARRSEATVEFVCLLPLTRDTHDLLDRMRLSQLARGAHLVNVARGDIVVDADLIALLDEGHLGGAMLDVFREEPLPPAHPFWHHPRIEMTPHVSAMTLIADSVAQIAAKIRRIEQGLAVTGVVDRTRQY